MPPINQSGHYTYADYCTWDNDQRWELIGGIPYEMSSPTQRHQELIIALTYQFRTITKGKPCKLLIAPFDVRLNADGLDDTVVQPDLLVVCDPSKLDGKCCIGAPDLVVEILSPSSAKHDRVVKLELYQNAGVQEYWIVDPDSKTIKTHLIQKDCHNITVYSETDIVPVSVLDDCEIDLREVFSE